MCKYCQNIKTGDDYQSLLEIPINIQIGSFKLPDDNAYSNSVEISIDPGELSVWAWLGGECQHVDSIPISYCPVCGQLLKELEDNK